MKPKDRKKALSRVPGRGLHMDGGTRIVPAKNKDRRRPKTRELLRGDA